MRTKKTFSDLSHVQLTPVADCGADLAAMAVVKETHRSLRVAEYGHNIGKAGYCRSCGIPVNKRFALCRNCVA